ncbi:MAG TPA: cation:dicarboxylase symporter family transporter [Syntrophomonas sp.]|nr:cation:dicarboxylase symporter family transporter [Syntrophomonas sp.]
MADKREFKLELASIEGATVFVGNLLQQYKCTDRDIVRAQLFTEETILYWAKAVPDNPTLHISLRKRFKTISLSLSYGGLPSNPLVLPDEEEAEAEFNFLSQNILIGLSNVSYAYENGHNVVVFTIKVPGINPVLFIFIALATAVASGLIINNFLPSISKGLSASLLTPLSNAFFGLLNAVVIPFLFMSVIASIFNMENLAQMKRVFRILFGWFTGITVIAAAISWLAGIIYFPLQNGAGGTGGSGAWSQIVAMFFDIIPSNIFQSFLSNNTLQIIFLAVITGIAMLTLKGRFPVVTNAINETNLILSTLMDAICSLMPWVIYICILDILLSKNTGSLVGAIGAIVIICACMLVLFLLCVLSVAFIEKKNPVTYLKTIGPVLLIALSTASSSATFAPHTMIAGNKQGIRDYLTNFSIPVGSLFSKPFLVPFLFILTLFLGSFYHVLFSPADLLSLALLCIILSVAVPPTQGMGTFLFTILFNRYGIPLEGLAMAATLFILFDYPVTSGDVLSINLSMLHTEHRLRKTEGAGQSLIDMEM